MYHIMIDGYRITTKAITLADVVAQYGSVIALESKGYRLVKV